MPSQLPSVLELPPTRVRTRIERRIAAEVDVEIPAGIEAFFIRGMLLINAGSRGFMTASDAAALGLVKICDVQQA